MAAEAHLTILVTAEIRLLNPVAQSAEPIYSCAHCFCQLFAIRIGSDSLLVDERDPDPNRGARNLLQLHRELRDYSAGLR